MLVTLIVVGLAGLVMISSSFLGLELNTFAVEFYFIFYFTIIAAVLPTLVIFRNQNMLKFVKSYWSGIYEKYKMVGVQSRSRPWNVRAHLYPNNPLPPPAPHPRPTAPTHPPPTQTPSPSPTLHPTPIHHSTHTNTLLPQIPSPLSPLHTPPTTPVNPPHPSPTTDTLTPININK
jgi:hypothetical protein